MVLEKNTKLTEEEKEKLREITELLSEEELRRTKEMIDNVRNECVGDDDLMFLFKDANDHFFEYTKSLMKIRKILSDWSNNRITEEEYREVMKKENSDIQIIQKASRDSLAILVRNMENKGKKTHGIEKFVNNAAYAKLAAEAVVISLPDLVKADMELYNREFGENEGGEK